MGYSGSMKLSTIEYCSIVYYGHLDNIECIIAISTGDQTINNAFVDRKSSRLPHAIQIGAISVVYCNSRG